jgi:OOP family OmpA-OmpF porin
MIAKRILLAMVFIGMLSCLSEIHAQSINEPNDAFGAKVLFVDYGIINNAEDLRITNALEVFYRRKISDKFGLQVPIRTGMAHFMGELNNEHFSSLDATLLYHFGNQSGNLLPYLMAGGGLVMENFSDISPQVPVGAGLSYKVAENTFVNIQGEARFGFEEFRNSLVLGVGLMHRLGKRIPDRDKDGVPDETDPCPDDAGPIELRGCPDTDGDKVPDNFDDCPNDIGLPELSGCPDKDNDGIADKDDECPDEAGLAEFNGCPDSDGDGIPDKDDECPNEAGTAENNGCPDLDRDNDGIPDDQDQCPDEPGTAETQGCPDSDGDGVSDADDRCPELPGDFGGCPDSDGDGIIDPDDTCPDQAGLINNKGCPELNEEEKQLLNFAMRAVQFNTGRAELKQESFPVLDQIKGIMDRYPGYKLTISGHTDSVGDEDTNEVLSRERAKSCYQYLVSQGVPPERLAFQGFGESRPIATNRTSQGRRLNRRVEFDLSLE